MGAKAAKAGKKGLKGMAKASGAFKKAMKPVATCNITPKKMAAAFKRGLKVRKGKKAAKKAKKVIKKAKKAAKKSKESCQKTQESCQKIRLQSNCRCLKSTFKIMLEYSMINI